MNPLAYAIPSVIAVAVAFGLAVAGVLQYRLAAKVSAEARVICVVMIIGIGALLSVALTSRTLDEIVLANGVMATYDDYAEGFAASRWLSLLLIGTSLIEVARGWVLARSRPEPDPAKPILIALLLFYFGTMLIQAVASFSPGFSFRSLYVPLVLLGIYYQRPRRIEPILVATKWTILLLTLGSLAGIVLSPNFVMHRPDPGWIPGLNWRLYGLTEHANALGPMALLAIVLELYSPSRWRPLRWLHLLSAVTVFVLAQSKTAWAAAPVMLAVVWLPLSLRTNASAARSSRGFERSVWTVVGALAIAVLLAASFVALDGVDFFRGKTDIMTLTGRTRIWEITLQAWSEDKLFGYGPEVWGFARQLQYHMFYVGHAHNQIVQSLGEAGLVGTALLLLYVGTLFQTAVRRFADSRGIVLVLLLLVLVRCVTEAPLSREGLLSWDTFLQALLLITACHSLRESGSAASAPLQSTSKPAGREAASTASRIALASPGRSR